jgi:hypothetical protein
VTPDFTRLELQRARWRRTRDLLRLVDPEAEDFAIGGLARFMDEPSVRLLILPADPEATLIEFDEEMWSWWLQERSDPATRRPIKWGPFHRSTSNAAVIFNSYREDGWENYLALHRNGGLEMELGGDGAHQRGEGRTFRLVGTVERIWFALNLYREIVERFGVEGPWEVSLALRKTEGAILEKALRGGVEPSMGSDDPPLCLERGVLLNQEITSWPDKGKTRPLAFTIGAWIEDSWGVHERRFWRTAAT